MKCFWLPNKILRYNLYYKRTMHPSKYIRWNKTSPASDAFILVCCLYLNDIYYSVFLYVFDHLWYFKEDQMQNSRLNVLLFVYFIRVQIIEGVNA
jgi:hypothetical protein